jgi:hypothetical protein
VGLVREISGGLDDAAHRRVPWIAVAAVLPPTRRRSSAGAPIDGHDAAWSWRGGDHADPNLHVLV